MWETKPGKIENLAGVKEVKKESIYWWFVNRNKRQRKSIKRKSMLDKSSLKQDVDVKGCVDWVSPGTLERGKRAS